MILSAFKLQAGATVRVAHNGPNTTAYCYYASSYSHALYEGHVGQNVPKTWKEWNVLGSWTLIAEDDKADRRWKEVRG